MYDKLDNFTTTKKITTMEGNLRANTITVKHGHELRVGAGVFCVNIILEGKSILYADTSVVTESIAGTGIIETNVVKCKRTIPEEVVVIANRINQ
jgi:hypothetical protein